MTKSQRILWIGVKFIREHPCSRILVADAQTRSDPLVVLPNALDPYSDYKKESIRIKKFSTAASAPGGTWRFASPLLSSCWPSQLGRTSLGLLAFGFRHMDRAHRRSARTSQNCSTGRLEAHNIFAFFLQAATDSDATKYVLQPYPETLGRAAFSLGREQHSSTSSWKDSGTQSERLEATIGNASSVAPTYHFQRTQHRARQRGAVDSFCSRQSRPPVTARLGDVPRHRHMHQFAQLRRHRRLGTRPRHALVRLQRECEPCPDRQQSCSAWQDTWFGRHYIPPYWLFSSPPCRGEEHCAPIARASSVSLWVMWCSVVSPSFKLQVLPSVRGQGSGDAHQGRTPVARKERSRRAQLGAGIVRQVPPFEPDKLVKVPERIPVAYATSVSRVGAGFARFT